MTKRVRAVTFDLDDTLWSTGAVIGAAVERFFAHLAQEHPKITATYTKEDFGRLMTEVTTLKRTALERVSYSIIDRRPGQARERRKFQRAKYRARLDGAAQACPAPLLHSMRLRPIACGGLVCRRVCCGAQRPNAVPRGYRCHASAGITGARPRSCHQREYRDRSRGGARTLHALLRQVRNVPVHR
jgi:hypothetical protein